MADLTISLAGKIISQNLDGQTHKELIDQYIDQLVLYGHDRQGFVR